MYMAKLTLTTIGSRYASVDALNANFDAIEAALENTLSLDGTSPNALGANLDMDSNFILNLPTPTNNTHAATKQYVDDSIGGSATASDSAAAALASEIAAAASAAAALASEVAAASSASTATTQASNASTSASDALNNANSSAVSSASSLTNANNASASADLAQEWAVSASIVEATDYSAKQWAVYTGGTVDGSNYSAKQYAQNTAADASYVASVAGSLAAVLTFPADMGSITDGFLSTSYDLGTV
jgi:hypothetical protein